jgi:hypothetical protein
MFCMAFVSRFVIGARAKVLSSRRPRFTGAALNAFLACDVLAELLLHYGE